MTFKLHAKSRLIAEQGADQAAKSQRDSQKKALDQRIENKEQQVHTLKHSMPSRQNRMKVSPAQRNRTEKQIHRTQEDVSDLRLQKSKIG